MIFSIGYLYHTFIVRVEYGPKTMQTMQSLGNATIRLFTSHDIKRLQINENIRSTSTVHIFSLLSRL